MTVTVDGRVFPATIEDAEAGRELAARLPLTLDMGELNGVGKYATRECRSIRTAGKT